MKTILIAVLAVLSVVLAGGLVCQRLNPSETSPIVVNQPQTNLPQVNQPPANCVKEDEEIYLGMDSNRECCEQGMIFKRDSFFNDFLNQCVDSSSATLGPIGKCINCGNGICGKGENKCNCPQDCKGNIDGITIGQIEMSNDQIKEIKQAIEEGYQPWRGDAFSVLKADGLQYGFTAQELSNAKQISYALSAGVAEYAVIHNEKSYDVILFRYMGAPSFWFFSEISQK